MREQTPIEVLKVKNVAHFACKADEEVAKDEYGG
jgi:hypothetical protein